MAFGMSMKHSIVFLDRGTLGAELRAPGFPHSYQEYAATPAQLVAERLRDATIAIINKVPMPAETLAQLPKLRLIAVAATGTDIVDKDYCRVKGITVVNIRDYAFNTVPEHVFALIFALRRNLIAYREDVRNGAWQRAEQFCFFTHPIRDVAGSNSRHCRIWCPRQGSGTPRRGLGNASACDRLRARAGPRRPPDSSQEQ